jgi:hypothetical protein
LRAVLFGHPGFGAVATHKIKRQRVLALATNGAVPLRAQMLQCVPLKARTATCELTFGTFDA